MLWSVCTSTFIPFFSVLVTTGNCCASLCARAVTAAAANSVVSNSPRTASLNLHMEPPSGTFSAIQTYKPHKMFYRLAKFRFTVQMGPHSELLRHQSKHPRRPARSAFQLNRRRNQERARFRQFLQVRQILQLIDSRTQHGAMHG